MKNNIDRTQKAAMKTGGHVTTAAWGMTDDNASGRRSGSGHGRGNAVVNNSSTNTKPWMVSGIYRPETNCDAQSRPLSVCVPLKLPIESLNGVWRRRPSPNKMLQKLIAKMKFPDPVVRALG